MLTKSFNPLLLVVLLVVLLVGCGGSNTGDNNTPTAPIYTISLDFERLDTGTPNPFTVTASVAKDGQPLSGLTNDLQIQLGRGSRDAIAEVAPGQYQFTVTPTQTGEHLVKITYQDVTMERTALVLSEVNSDWGQPMAVPGLVNTAGYEDGVTVSPDGEYVFVQYSPMYFSAFQLYSTSRANGGCGSDRLNPTRCTHTWLDDTIGPYTAPERPGFFTGRISNGTWLHNANSWGVAVDQSPILAPSTMFYGFKRQADGSFAEPFYLAFDDENDAITNPFGLSLMMNGDGTATILFAFNDPSNPDMVDLDGDGKPDVESLTDVFTTDITLGQNNTLGTFVYSGTPGTPPVRSTPFASQLVNFGKTGINGIAGTQGNPHLFQDNNIVQSIWTDDEYDNDNDTGDIAVYTLTSGSFPDGTWSKTLLPTVVNQPLPSKEIQPFFTGTGLYFTHSSDTRNPEVYYAAYSGTQTASDYLNAALWSTPQKILGIGTADAEGKIIAIGEPTIANFQGSEYLYFVYGYIRGYDSVSGLPDIDMQAGFIKKKP